MKVVKPLSGASPDPPLPCELPPSLPTCLPALETHSALPLRKKEGILQNSLSEEWSHHNHSRVVSSLCSGIALTLVENLKMSMKSVGNRLVASIVLESFRNADSQIPAFGTHTIPGELYACKV